MNSEPDRVLPTLTAFLFGLGLGVGGTWLALPRQAPGEAGGGPIAQAERDATTSANAIHVPAQRINDILAGRRLITPDMALRLGRYFGNRPAYWLSLQDEWLLRKATLENAEEISSIHPLTAA